MEYTAERINNFIDEFIGDLLEARSGEYDTSYAPYYEIEVTDESLVLKYHIESKCETGLHERRLVSGHPYPGYAYGTSTSATSTIPTQYLVMWETAKEIIEDRCKNIENTTHKVIEGKRSKRSRFRIREENSYGYMDQNLQYIRVVMNKLFPSTIDNIEWRRTFTADDLIIYGDIEKEGFKVGPIVFTKDNNLGFYIYHLTNLYEEIYNDIREGINVSTKNAISSAHKVVEAYSKAQESFN